MYIDTKYCTHYSRLNSKTGCMIAVDNTARASTRTNTRAHASAKQERKRARAIDSDERGAIDSDAVSADETPSASAYSDRGLSVRAVHGDDASRGRRSDDPN